MSDYRITTTVESGNYSATVSSTAASTPRQPVQDLPLPAVSSQAVEKDSQVLAVRQQGKAAQPEKPTPQETDKAALPITNLSNVFLKFKVDEDTSNITVYVIDRETHRVLRSIPPEDMNKLQAGDLLELLA
jgi:uncharacterized FlaG/YvyC family protein